MKRHISPLSRHLSDAYKDVRGVKVTTKGGKYALHRPCCLLYTDATLILARPRFPFHQIFVFLFSYSPFYIIFMEICRISARFSLQFAFHLYIIKETPADYRITTARVEKFQTERSTAPCYLDKTSTPSNFYRR